jgi:hypothetical protein
MTLSSWEVHHTHRIRFVTRVQAIDADAAEQAVLACWPNTDRWHTYIVNDELISLDGSDEIIPKQPKDRVLPTIDLGNGVFMSTRNGLPYP